MDKTTGFWLIHSIPQFPEPPNVSYLYPKSGKENGQSALCISFNTKDVGSQIIQQLIYMRPNVYSLSATDDVERLVRQIMDLKNRKWPKDIDQNIEEIRTIKGERFTSFSRNSKAAAAGDLYSSMIAPSLKTNLMVETWRRGAGTPLDSNCSSQYKVQNIQEVKLNFASDSKVPTTGPFRYMEDHSKWAVSDSSQKSYACVGDINRMRSQFKRGGGSVCINNPDVWSLMQSSVYEVESCKRPPPRTSNDRNSGSRRTRSTTIPFYAATTTLVSSMASRVSAYFQTSRKEPS